MSCNGCEVCPECYCAARDKFLPMGRSIERGTVVEYLNSELRDGVALEAQHPDDAWFKGYRECLEQILEHLKPAHAAEPGDK